MSDAAYSCDHCGRYSVVTWYTDYDPSESYRSGEPEDYDRAEWAPAPRIGEGFPDVPDPIAHVAREAFVCRNVGAYRGALALARAVLEATAKKKGATASGILAKIEWLRDEGHIRAAVYEAADEIRISGNSIAHGDLTLDVVEEECDEVLALMKDVLNEVFESETRRERLRAARAARVAQHHRSSNPT